MPSYCQVWPTTLSAGDHVRNWVSSSARTTGVAEPGGTWHRQEEKNLEPRLLRDQIEAERDCP